MMLGPPALIDTVTSEVGLIGADRTMIIRTLTFLNTAAGGRVITFMLDGPTSGAMAPFLKVTLAANESRIVDTWLVLDQSTGLYAISTGTDSVIVTAFGALLLGTPL